MPESSEDRDEALGRYVDALLGGAEAEAPADEAAPRCREAAEALREALAEDLPADEPPPALPPDYELMGELGRGGMGVVYKVRQKSLDRLLALKVLRPDERLFEEAVRRFQREARSLARLRHRHIVSIHEVGEADRRVYFTMDLIEGATLAELLRRNEVTPTRAVRIVRQVASAIGYAHAQGVVHRDLKPGNILVDGQGDAYVVDFGLARDLSGPADVTASGDLLGTPAYMAPEQARGDVANVGEATDVYALGVVLYEALTRRAPFGGQAVAQTIHDVLHREPRPPRRLNPKVPRDLEIVCLKAMAKEPGRRYPTMRAFLEDLERFESGRPILARPPSVAYRSLRFARRHRGAVGAVAAAVVLAAGVFLAVVQPYLGQSPENLFSTAESLHDTGEHAAAAVLLERALGKHGTGPLGRRLLASLARCRIETAEARPAAQAVEELEAVAAHGKRLYADPFDDGWPEEGDVLWALANAQVRAGLRDTALQTFGRAKEVLSEKRERSAGFVASLGAGFKTDVYAESMNRLLPALLDPAHAGHGAALAFLAKELGDPFDDEAAMEWLGSLGDRCIPIVVEAVGAAASDPDRERFREAAEAAQTLFRVHPGRALQERLAAAMEDPGKPGDAKAVYYRSFLEAADLPFGFRWNTDGGFVLADTPTLRAAALAHWREVRDLPRPERLQRGIPEAIRLLESDPDHNDTAADWLVSHTGFDPGTGTTAVYDAGRWKAWRAAHGNEAPAARLAKAVGLDPEKVPPPAELLELFLRASGPRRAWLHHLMALGLPEAAAVPLRGSRPYEPGELAMEWRRLLSDVADDRPYVLRAVGLAWRDGRPEPDILWTDVRPIRVGRPETIERTLVREEPGAMQAGFLVPGLGHRADARPLRTTHLSAGARLGWRPDGLMFEFGGGGRVSVAGGSRISTGGGGRDAVQGMITPDTHVWEKSFGTEGPSPSIEFALAVALPPGSDARPWTLEDWRRTLAENLKTLADGLSTDAGKKLEPFYFKYQQSVWLLPRVAAVLSVPAAADALRRIDEHLRTRDRGDSAKKALPLARLRSGDPAPFEGPDADERLAEALDDDFDPAAAWTRLALGSPDGPIRAGALERLALLERIHSDVAAALAEAARAGLRLPGPLAARLRDAHRSPWPERFEAAWFYFVLAGAIGLFALVALARTFGGPRAQVRLVAGGLLVVACYLTVDGRDVLPDALGYALAALGAGLLARGGPGAGRLVSPALFAGAALLDAAGRLGLWPGVLLPLSGPAAGLAIAATPFLARALDPRLPWPWLSFAIWSAAVASTAVGSLPGEPLGRISFSGGWAAGLLAVLLVAVAGLLRALRRAAISATAGTRPRAG